MTQPPRTSNPVPRTICFFLAIILVFFGTKIYSQNIDNLLTAPWFGLSGGVSAQTVFSGGINEQHRTPFTYLLSGNLSPVVKGFAVPLSFSYSNQQVNYGYVNPFKQFEIAPSYKWVKLYIGTANMSFSPNTFSGQQFKGFGAELTPNIPFKVSFMYGQLRNAVLADSASNRQASYRRMGFGSKMSYTKNQHVFGFTFFKAKDDPNSLNKLLSSSEEQTHINLPAQENLTTEFSYNGTVAPNLRFSANYALSQFNADHTALSEKSKGVIPFFTSFMMSNNAATSYFRSYKLGLNYRWIGVGYERIDPGYQTLGTFFSNNDMENFTINANYQFSKISLGGNFCVQRNDLHNVKETSARRLVWAVNTNWQTSEQINMSANYSNFTSFTYIRPISEINDLLPIEYIDTLSFSQLSQSADYALTWSLPAQDGKRQNLSYLFSFQDAKDVKHEGRQQGLRAYNQSLSYSVSLKSEDNYAIGLNSTIQETPDRLSHLIGVTISQGTSVYAKQIKLRNSLSYNVEISKNTPKVHIFNLRTGATYTYQKNHNFSANLVQQIRFLPETKNKYNLVFSLTYGYNF
jgi:hypothetical protein